MYKFLLLFLFFAGSTQTEHIIPEPITSEISTEEDVFPDQETFESNRLQRGITAWLGLPEKQLTLRNAGLNSISHIVNGIETEYRARFYNKGRNQDKRKKEVLVITLTLVAINLYIKYNSPLYGETLSKISATRIIQDLLNSHTIKRLLIDICNRNNLLKEEDSFRVLFFINLLLYFKRLFQRVAVIKKIKDKNLAIESRMIPEEFKGREYFILNSPLNNICQNYFKNILILKDLGLMNYLIEDKTEGNFRVEGIGDLINFPKHSFERIVEILRKYLVHPAKSYDMLHYKVFSHIQNVAIQSNINCPTLTYETTNTISEIPATIPWAKRLYILKSDAEEHLDSEDYETLTDLVQMDYHYAMEKVIHFSRGRRILISQAKKNLLLPFIS